MATFEAVLADVDRRRDERTSALAHRYPCATCHGEQEVEDHIGAGTSFVDVECPDCSGTGHSEYAEDEATIDALLAANEVTVSTRTEHRLRDMLIDVYVGADDLSFTAEEMWGDGPVVEPMSHKAIDDAVHELFDAVHERSKCDEPRASYATAYGAMTAIVGRILDDVVQGRTLQDAIGREVKGARMPSTD